MALLDGSTGLNVSHKHCSGLLCPRGDTDLQEQQHCPIAQPLGAGVQASGWLFLSDASQSRALQGCSLNSTTEGLSEPLLCQAHRKEKIKAKAAGAEAAGCTSVSPQQHQHTGCVFCRAPLSAQPH